MAATLIAAGIIGPTSGAAAVLQSGALSLALTGASAFGSIMAGQQQAAASRYQARQAELQSRMEAVKGREQSLQIKQQFESDLASANAAFGAKGLVAQGSSLAAVQAGRDRATRDLDVLRFGVENAVEANLSQAQQYRSQAKAQASAGFTNAFGSLTSNRYIGSLLD